ncbi:MAG: LacI family transcriptional regulator [Clostridia bacterium]|nr:LacI family transcriptional regulator [Clostridia bacterium]
MKITIKDIANYTNVSVATVSRVLTRRGYVKSDTRDLIMEAIEKTGYEYRGKKSNPDFANDLSILIICGDISSQVYVSYIRGIQECLDAQKYKTMIVNTSYDPMKEEMYLQYAAEHHFCGVIMLNVMETKRMINLIRTAKAPIVFMNRYIKTLDTDIICMDNYRCGYIATQHLIDAGHRRIVHLCGPKNSTSCMDRKRGYIDCMENNGIPVARNSVFMGDLLAESGKQFADHLIKNLHEVTAVYSANDCMAAAMAERLLQNKIHIPADISVVCTDNTPASISGKVQLTCVSYDTHQMGIAAGALMIERLNHPNTAKKKVTYCPILTKRDSVAAPKALDAVVS